MKQTAVEWLVEQLDPNIMWTPKAKELYKQAKEMEAKQMRKDFKAGNDSACMEHENIEDYFKQYIKSER